MKTLAFYGVYDRAFKLDDVIWRAVECPYDGEHSVMEKIERVENLCDFRFSRVPFVYVKIRKSRALEGYELFDSVGHVWLTVGTDRFTIDYYPKFVFRYSPKPIRHSFEEFIA